MIVHLHKYKQKSKPNDFIVSFNKAYCNVLLYLKKNKKYYHNSTQLENLIIFLRSINKDIPEQPSKIKQLIVSLYLNNNCVDILGNKTNVINPISVKKEYSKYELYLHSEQWHLIKKWLFQIKGENCEICGTNHGLQIHHLTYENLYHENIEDLKILCKKCHSNIHHN